MEFCHVGRVRSLVRVGELTFSSCGSFNGRNICREVCLPERGGKRWEERKGEEEKGRPTRYRWRRRKYRVTLKEVKDSEQGPEGQELNPRAETAAANKTLHT